MKPIHSSNILIIDDEEVVREVLSDFLAVMGYPSEQVTNGVAGLESIAAGQYHAAFVDVRMPGIDGIEFVKRMQVIRPEIPVIVITGHGCEETRKEVMTAGAFGFLRKPFHFSEIRDVMKRLTAEGFMDAEEPARMSG